MHSGYEDTLSTCRTIDHVLAKQSDRQEVMVNGMITKKQSFIQRHSYKLQTCQDFWRNIGVEKNSEIGCVHYLSFCLCVCLSLSLVSQLEESVFLTDVQKFLMFLENLGLEHLLSCGRMCVYVRVYCLHVFYYITGQPQDIKITKHSYFK